MTLVRHRRFARTQDFRCGVMGAGMASLLLAACGGGSDGGTAAAPITVAAVPASDGAGTSAMLLAPATPVGVFANPTFDPAGSPDPDGNTEASADIGWDASAGATGYRVRYRVDGGALHVVTVGATPGTHLDELAAGGLLSVSVAAFSGPGDMSAGSDPVTATLPREPTGPEMADYENADDYSNSGQMNGVSVVVMKNGRMVYPENLDSGDTTPHILASGTKSFSCALAGFAEQDELLELGDSASSYITDWATSNARSQITLENLLGLNSGLHGHPDYSPGNVDKLDTYKLAVNEIDSGYPAGGEAFIYDPLSFMNIALIFQISSGGDYADNGKVLGGTDSVDYLQTKLFGPLGIQPDPDPDDEEHIGYRWKRDLMDHPQMAGGATFAATDWLKYGRFFLQRGTWQTDRLLPAATIDYCTAGTGQPEGTPGGYVNPAFHGYGLTWWLNRTYDGTFDPDVDIVPAAALPICDPPEQICDADQIAPDVPDDMYMAAGAGFQRLYVIPSLGLVVVRFATDGATSGFSDNEFLGKLIGTVD